MYEFEAYQRKVDICTNEWHLPKKPVSDYYNFKYLKEALDEVLAGKSVSTPQTK